MSQTANIQNLSLVRMAVDSLLNRHANLPGIGVIYGPAGYGKSTAMLAVANQTRAYYIQMRSAWSRRTLLEKILIEMGLPAKGTIAQMLDAVCRQLAASRRPLMIDEFDFCLTTDKMVELVRDIYEASQSPIIVAGEELLPRKLERWERFHSRVLSWVPAQPVSFEDARQLVPIYCPDVPVADDWLRWAVESSGGSVRRVSTNLFNANSVSALEGLAEISIATWEGRDLYTGKAPERSL
jgi:DNA transposition AAA+ family ATPase